MDSSYRLQDEGQGSTVHDSLVTQEPSQSLPGFPRGDKDSGHFGAVHWSEVHEPDHAKVHSTLPPGLIFKTGPDISPPYPESPVFSTSIIIPSLGGSFLHKKWHSGQ